jgi:hypothetical protein
MTTVLQWLLTWQISVQLIVGPRGSAHSFTIYLSPIPWKFGFLDGNASITLGDGTVINHRGIGLGLGPLKMYASER